MAALILSLIEVPLIDSFPFCTFFGNDLRSLKVSVSMKTYSKNIIKSRLSTSRAWNATSFESLIYFSSENVLPAHLLQKWNKFKTILSSANKCSVPNNILVNIENDRQ